jgi:tetratricopeptide (TPR) repeat protein
MAKLTTTIMTLAMVVAAANVRAEDGPVDKLYGEGVHAFFSGDLEAAAKHLDASIAAGNRDPRCYYYRGLALSRMGQADAAKADLQMGAALEAQSPDTTSLINRSIQRIQGLTRISLEKYRTDAQLAALAARKARDAQRYGAARASATEALRNQATTPGAVDVLPEGTSPDNEATEAAPAGNNPFGDDPAGADAAAPDAAATETPMDAAPMGEAPMVETPDATETPLPEAPMGEAPATEETPDNLFGEEPAAP